MTKEQEITILMAALSICHSEAVTDVVWMVDSNSTVVEALLGLVKGYEELPGEDMKDAIAREIKKRM